MSYVFSGCNSLISLPDISKWDTSNVTDMRWMFNECNSLISLPDISKWHTFNIKSINEILSGCVNNLIRYIDIMI